MKRQLFVQPRPNLGRGLATLALVLAGYAVTAAPATAGPVCTPTGWTSYSPKKTFLGYQESGWYADGTSGSHKYYRQFGYHSGEYKYRRFDDCTVEQGTFYLIQYREKVCLYYTCGSPTGWYNQRWSGPNYREGALSNGWLVRW